MPAVCAKCALQSEREEHVSSGLKMKAHARSVATHEWHAHFLTSHRSPAVFSTGDLLSGTITCVCMFCRASLHKGRCPVGTSWVVVAGVLTGVDFIPLKFCGLPSSLALGVGALVCPGRGRASVFVLQGRVIFDVGYHDFEGPRALQKLTLILYRILTRTCHPT